MINPTSSCEQIFRVFVQLQTAVELCEGIDFNCTLLSLNFHYCQLSVRYIETGQDGWVLERNGTSMFLRCGHQPIGSSATTPIPW